MSDDTFDPSGGERNGGLGGGGRLIRHSRVTATLDTVFDLLAPARRRYLLYYLHDVDEVTDVDDAVDAVCAYEARGTEREGFPRRERVRIDLHHDQIPRLADAGVVEYDSRQGTIRFRGIPSLEEWLEDARRMELE